MRQIFPPQTSKIMFKRHEAEGRQDVLLNCCDHDPGGLNISEFLRSNLNDLARAVNWRPNKLIIERFGLNYDFIEAQRLTWIDNLHPDHNKPYVENYLKQFGARKVEANALVLRPALAVHSAVRQSSSTCPKARRKNIGIDSTFGPSSQEQQPQLAPERKRRPSWRDADLAARMGDDPLKSRALLFNYLHHPTRELELGRMWCNRLDQAFGLGSEFFLNLEKAWREVRRRNGPRDCLCSV
jgi:hypothetical protein